MPTHETEGAGRGLSEAEDKCLRHHLDVQVPWAPCTCGPETPLAKALYAHERTAYPGLPPWEKAWFGDHHAKGVRNTCVRRAKALVPLLAEHVDTALAEVARLTERLAAVEALLADWEQVNSTTSCPGCSSCTQRQIAADRLRAALADPASVLRERDAAKFGQGVQTAREHGWLKALAMNPYRDRGGDDG